MGARPAGFWLTGIVLLAACPCACTVGPNYRPDAFAVPEQFSEAPHAATPDEIARTDAEMADWWALFGDPDLNALVRVAIAGNYDLKIADQHILAGREDRIEAASAWYPQVDAMAGGGDNRHSIVIDNWPVRPGNNANRPGASLLTYGAQASWEFDVFGRIRRDVEASDRAIDVSIEARRATLMALLSDLAGDYVDLRATQARLAIAHDNVHVAQDALDLTQRLFTHGIGNDLQVSQAQTERDAQEARLEPLMARIERDAHAIAMLAGQPPGALDGALRSAPVGSAQVGSAPVGTALPRDAGRGPTTSRLIGMAHPFPWPSTPPFPATLPSIVVANRPDIREAERSYAENTARIGVAVADLYPKFTAPLQFNPQASAAYQTFEAGALAWQFLMLASLPVAHGGRVTAEIAHARAVAEASRLRYRRTVLTGFREVQDAMSDWRHDERLIEALERASADAQVTNQRATKLFAAGLSDFLGVLSSERTLLDLQDQLAQGREARLRDAVALYVAIGAGWQGRALADTQLPIDQARQNVLARAFSR